MSYLPDDYEPVEDRIRAFYTAQPEGRIETAEVGTTGSSVRFKAAVYRSDGSLWATGHALGETQLDKGYEKTETVAIGRALANANFAKQGARPSREEMDAFHAAPPVPRPASGPAARNSSQPASEKQIKFLRTLIDTVDDGPEIAAKVIGSTPVDLLDKAQASAAIEALKEAKENAKPITRATESDDQWYTVEPPEEMF